MMTPAQARCEQTTLKADGVKVFRLKVDTPSTDALKRIQPGRHIAILYPDLSGQQQRRLYSIVRKEGHDTFEIAVKKSGNQGMSDSLHSTLKEGSLIWVEYAAGNITVASIKGARHVLMAAAGIGITLPMALLNELTRMDMSGQRVPNVKLILSVPHVANIPFLHELIQLSLTRAWFTFEAYITREPVARTEIFRPGRPEGMDYLLASSPEAVVICGGHGFANTLRHTINGLYPDAELFIEAFTTPVASTTVAPAADRPTLRLAGTDLVISASPAKSILDNLEENGMAVKSQCRSGICGSCRIKAAGKIRSEPDFCLDDRDKAQGYALACCAFPQSGEIEVDLEITH